MAANSYGLSSVVFGIPATLTGFVVESFSDSSKPAINAEVRNETGQRVAQRYDDLTDEITLDVIVNGGSAPAAGTTFVYNTVTYEVTSVDVKQANKDFEKLSIKGKKSQYLALS